MYTTRIYIITLIDVNWNVFTKCLFYFFFCCREMCSMEEDRDKMRFWRRRTSLSYRRIYCTRSETHAKYIVSILIYFESGKGIVYIFRLFSLFQKLWISVVQESILIFKNIFPSSLFVLYFEFYIYFTKIFFN